MNSAEHLHNAWVALYTTAEMLILTNNRLADLRS